MPVTEQEKAKKSVSIWNMRSILHSCDWIFGFHLDSLISIVSLLQKLFSIYFFLFL